MGEEFEATIRRSAGWQSISESSRLCEACLRVLTRKTFRDKRCYPHHYSLKDFIASSEKCCICSWMLSVLSKRFRAALIALSEGRVSDDMIAEDIVPHPRTKLPHYLRANQTRVKWNLRVSFTGMGIQSRWSRKSEVRVVIYLNPSYKGYFPLDTTAYDSRVTRFWEYVNEFATKEWRRGLVLVPDEVLTALGIQTKLPSNTGSQETWSTIEKWIQCCSNKHRCMAGVNTSWYPTRLVERLPGQTFRVIRSDSSTFEPRSGRGYITLSHRWGDGDFYRLTTDTLPALEKGLPVSDLRKTFQDTLIIAERMNISYIWIDSLCIIQEGDYHADWREESKAMEKVYSNSFCNISADWGDESNGLFFERTPSSVHLTLPVPRVQRELPAFHGNLISILAWFSRALRPELTFWHHVHYRDLFEDVTDSPLNKRGWVLQERLLARRVLHFSLRQVTWECADSLAWEYAPVCLDKFINHSSTHVPDILPPYLQVKASMRRLSLSDGPGATQRRLWETLLLMYTQSDLTQQRDRLIAISGIARQLTPFKGQYVAGLWAKSMPEALMWSASFVHLQQKICRREATTYYAPTFSWAAADGEVYAWGVIDENVDAASASFIKHRDKSHSSAAADTILTGHLFGPLNTPIVEVRVRGILRSCRRVAGGKVVPTQSRLDQTLPKPDHSVACPSSSDDIDDGRPYLENGRQISVSYDRLGDANEDIDSAIYYYTLIVYAPTGEDDKSYGDASGLLLKSVDESMARFARVGYVRHWNLEHPFVDIRAPLGNERDLPAWNYDETTGEHTFYIV